MKQDNWQYTDSYSKQYQKNIEKQSTQYKNYSYSAKITYMPLIQLQQKM